MARRHRDAVLLILRVVAHRERVRSSGRVDPGEPLQLVTIEQLPKVLDRLPSSGVEISYRVFNLLQIGKLAPSELDDAAIIGRWIRIAREPLPHDAVSGQFDYSPERVDELIAQADELARDALEGLHDSALTYEAPAAQQPPRSRVRSIAGSRPVAT